MSYAMKPLRSLTAMCAALMIISTAQAQNEATVYVLKLNEANISSLKSTGNPLRSTIPEANRGKINAIVIGTVENQDEPAVTLGDKVQVSGDTAVIKMDDRMLNDMKKQPLRLDVGENSFSQVYISYQPAFDQLTETAQVPEEETSSEAPQIEPEAKAPPTRLFFMNLDDNETMRGEINGLDSFKIKCGFGEITMPLDQIAGIRFHTDDADSAVVILKNGDSLTGIPTVDAVKITTAWGHAEVAPEHIQSITTSANSSFSQNATDFGKRWELTTTVPVDTGGQPIYNN